MPLEQLAGRSRVETSGLAEFSPIECVVVTTICELFLDAATYPKSHVLCHRHVSAIEQRVKVRAEEKAVGEFVQARLAEGLMCAASRTGSVRSLVTTQRRSYASVTMTRNAP